jgi:hypothetical protein
MAQSFSVSAFSLVDSLKTLDCARDCCLTSHVTWEAFWLLLANNKTINKWWLWDDPLDEN